MKFNSLIPELSVLNIENSKKFYLGILGFKLEYERKQDKFAFISYEGAQIMLEEINGFWNTGDLDYPFGRGINFQINTNDIETLIKRLKENEIRLFRELMISKYKANENIYIEKEILVQDPDGYLLRFSETIEEKEKEVI